MELKNTAAPNDKEISVYTYIMVDHNSSGCSYCEPKCLTDQPGCTLDNNDDIGHCRMIEEQTIEEHNGAEQLEAERRSVGKHEKFICFFN